MCVECDLADRGVKGPSRPNECPNCFIRWLAESPLTDKAMRLRDREAAAQVRDKLDGRFPEALERDWAGRALKDQYNRAHGSKTDATTSAA